MVEEFGACEMGEITEKMVRKIKEEFIGSSPKSYKGRLEKVQPGQKIIA